MGKSRKKVDLKSIEIIQCSQMHVLASDQKISCMYNNIPMIL